MANPKYLIIEGERFTYEQGLKILKCRFKESPFVELKSSWSKIKPITFKEISAFKNMENRRVAMLFFGLDRLYKEINPTLIDSQKVTKTTTWVDSKGELEVKQFEDTYDLYEVSEKTIMGNSYEGKGKVHFVKFKDTSTDREYLLWVNVKEVFKVNFPRQKFSQGKVNAIQAIAWTIQTDVKKDKIQEILRQGDCVLVRPTDSNPSSLGELRSLSEKEYNQLIVAES
jgi:hypothetical protein